MSYMNDIYIRHQIITIYNKPLSIYVYDISHDTALMMQ